MKVVNITPYPDWLDVELWNDYIQYRIEIKAPLTQVGEKRALMKLERLIAQGGDQTAMVEATINSKKQWAGIFYREAEVITPQNEGDLLTLCKKHGISTAGRTEWDLRARLKAKTG